MRLARARNGRRKVDSGGRAVGLEANVVVLVVKLVSVTHALLIVVS
jgi:hypothetical protein